MFQGIFEKCSVFSKQEYLNWLKRVVIKPLLREHLIIKECEQL